MNARIVLVMKMLTVVTQTVPFNVCAMKATLEMDLLVQVNIYVVVTGETSK